MSPTNSFSLASPVIKLVSITLITLIVSACAEKLSVDELIGKASGYRDAGELWPAVIEFRSAVAENPTDANLRFLLGETLLEYGDSKGALKELEKAEQLGYPNPLREIARARLLNQEFQVLQANVESLEGAMPSHYGAAEKAELFALYGHAFVATGKLDEAEVIYARALNLAPVEEVKFGQAQLAFRRGDVKRADEILTKVLEENPNFAQGWAVTGDIRASMGQVTAAVAAYTKSVEANPYGRDGLLRLALLQIQATQYDDADATLAKLRKLSVNNAGALYAHGLLAFARDDLDNAKIHLETALQKAPQFASAELILGAIHFRLGNREQSERFVEDVWARFKGAPDVGRLLAAIYFQSGEFADALEVANVVLAKYSKDVIALRIAAHSALGLSQTSEAISYIHRLRDLKVNLADNKAIQVGVQSVIPGEVQSVLSVNTNVFDLPLDDKQFRLLLIAEKLQQQRFSEAMDEAKSILANEPNDVGALNVLGYVHLLLKETAQARTSWERVLEVEPGNRVAANQLALLAIANKKYDAARTLYDSILKYHPDDTETWLQISRLGALTNDEETERNALSKAAESAPDSPRPKAYLARYYLQRGNMSLAEDLLRPLSENDTNDPHALAVLAEIHIAKGEANAAVEKLERVMQQRPANDKGRYLLGVAYLAANQPAKANEQFQLGSKISVGIASDMARIRFETMSGKAEDAKVMLDRLNEQYRGHPEVQALTAWYNMATGKPKLAAENFAAVIKQYGGTSRLVRDRAQALWLSNQWDQTFAILQEWLQKHPNDADARYDLGAFQLRLNQDEEAKTSFEQVLVERPNDPNTLNNLAWILRKNEPERALALAQKAHDGAPSDPNIADTLGTLMLDSGSHSQALKLFEFAVQSSPNSPTYRFHLAKALMLSGARDEARQAFDELLKQPRPFLERAEAERLRASL